MDFLDILTPRAKRFLSVILCVIGVFITSFILNPSQLQKDHLFALQREQQSKTLDPLLSKLYKTTNTFSLKNRVNFFPQAHAAASYENAVSYIAIDMDSGQILEEQNSDAELPIASLTKVMSSVVGLDLLSSTQEVTISQNAATVEPTKIGVVPGQQMQVKELLQAMLMTSANDAAQALHDGVNAYYQKNVFVDAMNAKAAFLGLSHTHFANPEGFDNVNNYSTVKDLAILSHYALTQYPLIADIASHQYTELPADNFHKQFDLYNWNGLLGVYPGVYGLKIGNTGGAGYTTIVASQRGGHRVLVVLLGTSGVLERDQWAADLLDSAFQDAYGLSPVGITSERLHAKYATWQYWN